MPQLYRHEIDSSNHTCVIKVDTDFTGDYESRFRATFDYALEKQCIHIIFDVSRTDFMSSAGIAILLSFINKLKSQNGTLKLRGASQHIEKVLDTTGLTDFIQLE